MKTSKYKLPHGWNNLKIKNKNNYLKTWMIIMTFISAIHMHKNVNHNYVLSLTDYSIDFISSIKR